METLTLGSQGSQVTQLQQQLHQLGYTLTVDGIYGSGTQQVVQSFQQAHGLSADGIAGPQTLGLIATLVAGSTATTGNSSSIHGIDVSHFNGTINWSAVPKSEAAFVYHKATQGATYKDPMLSANMASLEQLGFLYGGYHFFVFSGDSVPDQVQNFLSCGIDFSKKGVLPPVLDVEWQATPELNQYISSNQAACVAAVQQWLSSVAQTTGRTPIIYTNTSFWHDYLGNPAGFENYPLWIASYTPAPPALPPGWSNYTMWQYSEQGSVTGITGNVDQDLFNGNMLQLQQLANM